MKNLTTTLVLVVIARLTRFITHLHGGAEYNSQYEDSYTVERFGIEFYAVMDCAVLDMRRVSINIGDYRLYIGLGYTEGDCRLDIETRSYRGHVSLNK